jgi:hypothetical protein
MWEVALSPGDSAGLIEGHAAIMSASTDRPKRHP